MLSLQARCRGFLARQALYARLKHYYDNEDQVVRAQRAFRRMLERKRANARVCLFQACAYAALKLERERRARETPKVRPLSHFRGHERAIVRLQRAWRATLYRRDFAALLSADEMSLAVVRRYLHLLDARAEDFDLELLVQSLTADVAKAIRENAKLEKDLDTMDVKIGLLVRNRISVQEVVSHSKTLLKKGTTLGRKDTFYLNPNGASGGQDGTLPRIGLKALKKESKEKLDSYQHLFYLLQTRPQFLAKLVFAMPQTKTNKFMESVILTLFNFGANPREEFLLCKLFQHALEEEVQSKVK